MKALQREARQRILQRSKIEFRVDVELMSALLDLARERKIPVGPMIREWVIERLTKETKQSSSHKSQLDVIEQKIDKLLSNRNQGKSAAS